MIGTTISHYKILAKLGEGAMGTVYKAEDTKLRRPVALKFFSPQVLGDGEEKARFVREAQAAAALDHPNLCTVHEIDEVDGQTFIAMAYIEGQSLRQKVKGGPLQIEQALDIAIQVAQGLQEAHGKGVVHRDIKPSNIMVTRKGQVKIMDFGLAQLAGYAQLTKTGTTLGTLAYMPPEQAQGERVDHRADIWALGVVIYEMLTGQVPFTGDYEQVVVYSILNENPESMTSLRPGVSVELERIVERALVKSPAERYQHVDQLLVDLRAVQKSLTPRRRTWLSVREPAAAQKPTPTAHGPRAQVFDWRQAARLAQNREMILGLVAAVSLIAALVLAFVRSRETPPEASPMRFSVDPPPQVRFMPVFSGPAVVSPDGRQVAFAAAPPDAQSLLWVRSLDSLEARALPGTEGASHPFWAPESRSLGFFAEGKLKKVTTSGGSAQTLCDAPRGRGGTWATAGDASNEGVIVFAPEAVGGLYRIAAAGGEPTPVTVLNPSRHESSHRQPSFLPDGRNFLYVVAGSQQDSTGIFVSSIDSDPNRRKRLVSAVSQAAYAPPTPWHPQAYLLFVRANTLMAQPFDADRLELTGEAFPMAGGIPFDGLRSVGDFSVSANGVLAYRQESSSAETPPPVTIALNWQAGLKK